MLVLVPVGPSSTVASGKERGLPSAPDDESTININQRMLCHGLNIIRVTVVYSWLNSNYLIETIPSSGTPRAIRPNDNAECKSFSASAAVMLATSLSVVISYKMRDVPEYITSLEHK
jgi:hypothetical protein